MGQPVLIQLPRSWSPRCCAGLSIRKGPPVLENSSFRGSGLARCRQADASAAGADSEGVCFYEVHAISVAAENESLAQSRQPEHTSATLAFLVRVVHPQLPKWHRESVPPPLYRTCPFTCRMHSSPRCAKKRARRN